MIGCKNPDSGCKVSPVLIKLLYLRLIKHNNRIKVGALKCKKRSFTGALKFSCKNFQFLFFYAIFGLYFRLELVEIGGHVTNWNFSLMHIPSYEKSLSNTFSTKISYPSNMEIWIRRSILYNRPPYCFIKSLFSDFNLKFSIVQWFLTL